MLEPSPRDLVLEINDSVLELSSSVLELNSVLDLSNIHALSDKVLELSAILELNSSVIGPAELTSFQANGCLLLPQAYSESRVAEISAWAGELLELAEETAENRAGLWLIDFERCGSGARTVCRIENFVNFHSGLKNLANGWLRDVVSQLMGEEAVLLKEKLNFKGASGGGGYAPHCDGPSAAAYCQSKRFVTAMVALTPHTEENGCLRVCFGDWEIQMNPSLNQNSNPNPTMALELVAPTEGGSKGKEGRVGGLSPEVIQSLDFRPIPCDIGSVLLFSGWTPHRSACNMSTSNRDAAFFIYNAKSDGGDQHDQYYRAFKAAS